MRSSVGNAARAFAALLLLCCPLPPCHAQAAAAQAGGKSPAAAPPAVESARWQYLLDELASEARGLPWEKS
ncbi:MAG TPA: hypothetical protein VF508_01660, partial [Pyrinomonadaceae bacterium]